MLKSCGVHVEIATRHYFFLRWATESQTIRGCGQHLRVSLRLTVPVNEIKCRVPSIPENYSTGDVTLHRLEETINGRVYHIEVSAVQPDRWRAYLVSMTGGPTALMPFYGSTPSEAADLLVSWLTRAHQVASSSV
jgi:hypothetical protein